jgi:hypothetical protein
LGRPVASFEIAADIAGTYLLYGQGGEMLA